MNFKPIYQFFSFYPFLNGGENQLSKKWFVLPRFTLLEILDFGQLCQPGYAGTNSNSCTQCAAGLFSDVKGSTECTQCTKGTISTSSGATVCTPCSTGATNNDDFTMCGKLKVTFLFLISNLKLFQFVRRDTQERIATHAQPVTLVHIRTLMAQLNVHHVLTELFQRHQGQQCALRVQQEQLTMMILPCVFVQWDTQEPIATHVYNVPLVLTRTLLTEQYVKLVTLATLHHHREQQVVPIVQKDRLTMMVLLSVVSV
eukprot:sb/3468556/